MTTTLTFRLESEQRKKLRNKARLLGKSESEYLREILAHELEERPMSAAIGHLKGSLSLKNKKQDDWGRGHSKAELARVNVWLLDTGPVIAFLDNSDPFHDFVGQALDGFTGQFVTTGAVVTEAMHFLRVDTRGPAQLADFLESTGATVVDCCQPKDLKNAVKLMRKYADTPMDFADASLVLLGDALGQTNICTLDRRGFSTYRTAAGKRFNLVLEEFS